MSEIDFLSKNSPWNIDGEENTGLLPIEGMFGLMYKAVGLIPITMCGIISHSETEGSSEEIDEEDRLFEDQRYFEKMMRTFGYASVCLNSILHWVSLVCIPIGRRNVYIVCDSLMENNATIYPNYESLKTHFLIMHTKGNGFGGQLKRFPLTICLYPLLGDKSKEMFMETVIRRMIDIIDDDRIPTFPWKDFKEVMEIYDI